ncbi:MAG: SDR family oxidoreductase [Planctomycetota bacterium]|nr:SDR family oxidoreductase [Planctomycetota bacterium]
MRVVVTGGAGFIGSHLCDHLIGKGHEVVCLDNLITGTTANIEHLAGRPDFKFIKHDVTEYIYLDGKVDAVMHLASPASPKDYLRFPIQTLKVGALGTHKALGLAKSKKARFLLASTSEVYGDPLEHPQRETYWGHVNPVGPRGVYDEAKRFAEAMTMAYQRFHRLDTRIARIFNTYGPRMRIDDGRALPTFVSQALKGMPLTVYGDGSQTRSFCYVSDTVDGLYKLLLLNYTDPVNLGNPDEVTILKLAQEVGEMAGIKPRIEYRPYPEDDPKVRRPDILIATTRLGWKPAVGRREGLAKTFEYFKKQGAEPQPKN